MAKKKAVGKKAVKKASKRVVKGEPSEESLDEAVLKQQHPAPDNPAGQLLLLVSRMRALLPEYIERSGSLRVLEHKEGFRTPGIRFWMDVLRFRRHDITDVNMMVGEVRGLLMTVCEQMAEAGGPNTEFFMRWHEPVEQAISFGSEMLYGDATDFWDQMSRVLTRDIVANLEACAYHLAGAVPDDGIDRTKLRGVYRDVTKLFDEVRKSDLDDYLKRYLLDKLELMRQAIELYQTGRSIKPLRAALESMVGSTFVDRDACEKTKATELGKRVWGAAKGLAVLVSQAREGPQLEQSIIELLPGADTPPAAEKTPSDEDVIDVTPEDQQGDHAEDQAQEDQT